MEGLFLPLLLLLLAVPLFLGTRRQKKAAQVQQALQESLADGDRVMTTSGLYATVVDTSDILTIDLEIADGVVTTWLRQAIREKVNPVEEYDEDEYEDEETEADKAEGTSSPQVAPPLEQRGN